MQFWAKMMLGFSAFWFCALTIPWAHGLPPAPVVVGVSVGKEVTAESLVGMPFSEFHRVWTNGLYLDDLEKLREQTGANRTEWLASAKDVTALTSALTALCRTQYDECVSTAMAGRLVEELVLRREPAKFWYHHPKAMRNCIDSVTRLHLAELRLWDAALAGLPADQFKESLLQIYRTDPPVWLTQSPPDAWKDDASLQRKVEQMVAARSKGFLKYYVTCRRYHTLSPRSWYVDDPAALSEFGWISAELFNWWTGYVVRALDLRPDDAELERICRPLMSRYLLVGKIDREEDLMPIEWMLKSLKSVGGIPDWTEYQQALGFEREFGFTNRHLTGVVLTNGMLNHLLADNDQVPKTPVRLPSKLIAEMPLWASFVPYRVATEGETSQAWKSVKLTADGERWAAKLLGLGTNGVSKLRAWIGPENDRLRPGWESSAGETIRRITFDRIAKIRLRPTVEALVEEYSHRSPSLFPSVEQVVERLIVSGRSFPFLCRDCDEIGKVLKEPVPR